MREPNTGTPRTGPIYPPVSPDTKVECVVCDKLVLRRVAVALSGLARPTYFCKSCWRAAETDDGYTPVLGLFNDGDPLSYTRDRTKPKNNGRLGIDGMW